MNSCLPSQWLLSLPSSSSLGTLTSVPHAGAHAAVHSYIRSAPHHGPIYVSVKQMLPALRAEVDKNPEVLSDIAAKMLSGDSEMLSLLGFGEHPAVDQKPSLSKGKQRRLTADILCHADQLTVTQSLQISLADVCLSEIDDEVPEPPPGALEEDDVMQQVLTKHARDMLIGKLSSQLDDKHEAYIRLPLFGRRPKQGLIGNLAELLVPPPLSGLVLEPDEGVL